MGKAWCFLLMLHMLSISMSQVKNALKEAFLRIHGTLIEKPCKYAFLLIEFCVLEFSSHQFKYKFIYQSIGYDKFLKC